MTAVDWTEAQINEIVAAHGRLEGPLLPILHAVQTSVGYIPQGAIPIIADALNLTRAEVYGVVTFYHDFRDKPPGRRIVKLCRAEACQAMGADRINAAVLHHFGVGWGETTPDGAVTVEAVYCLGLCSVAPAALIKGEPRGRCDAGQIIAMAERDQ